MAAVLMPVTSSDLAAEAEQAALNDALFAAGEVDEFDDPRLAEALALFEIGDYQGATDAAEAVEFDARRSAAAAVEELPTPSSFDPLEEDEEEAAAVQPDAWKLALDGLASAYEDAGDTDSAEALYLRMLAWREGAEQYRAGNALVANQLFSRSPEYRTVDDATWFLRGLKPDDGHAIPEVVGLLAMSEPVAAKAAVALYTLAMRPRQRPRITECGGLELIAKAVAYHVENAELQAAGCGTLRQLCKGHELAPRNRRALIEQLGGAESVVAALRYHQHDPEVQREACGCLYAATVGNAVGARRIVENDGITLCLNAISLCPDEQVGDAACKALEAMTQSAPPQQQSRRGSAASSPRGVEDCDVSWESCLRSERERGLQYCGEALNQQLQQGDRVILQSLLTCVRIFVADAAVCHRALGLVELVVACMSHFKGFAKLQVVGCDIICRLTASQLYHEEAVRVVCNAGSVTSICQAMQDLPCNACLQRSAICALRNLSHGADHHKTLAVRSGGIPATVTAMQRFPRDAPLQEQGVAALTNLCDTVGRAALCARLGAVEVIIAALKRHASYGHIAELGCIILCMFCDDNNLRQHVVRAGALSIAKTLSRNAASEEAQRWGCELLRDLSEHQV